MIHIISFFNIDGAYDDTFYGAAARMTLAVLSCHAKIKK